MKNDFMGLKAALIAGMTLLHGAAFAQCITPTVVTALPSQLCAPGGTTNLNASSNPGTSIAWFTVPTGGSPIGSSLSGANYSVSAAATTTFYAEAFTINSNSVTYNSTGAVQIFTANVTGNYTFQAWGGRGGNDGLTGANGGYAAGVFALNAGQTVAIYVGGQGANSASAAGGGWNGGGNAGPNGSSGSGGGASDVRFGGTALTNRILVAGGGAGAGNGINAGAGGGLSGDGFVGTPASGGSQTAGGTGGNGNGSLGQGGNHTGDGGGGGGGYYGGSAGSGDNGGGGGSSYIAGVTNGTTIAGSLSMPNPSGGAMTGNAAAGVVRVIFPSIGCVSPARAAVVFTVNPNPTITVNSGSVCLGRSFTITPFGASTYTITGGNTIVSPSVNSTYGVIGTNTITGCVSQASATSSVTINTLPVISITGTTSVCSGGTVSLTAGGASTYTWSTASNATGISVSPTSNTTYTLSGTSALGCVGNTASVAVTVNTLPVVSITGTNAVCSGNSVALIASGASTYTWSTVSNANSVTVAPTANTTYSLSGSSSFGCAGNTATLAVTVNSLPAVAITGTNALCSGGSVTLSASGATTYTWSTSSNSISIAVSPTVNTSYSLSGTSSLGCVGSTATLAVTVNTLPVITITGTTAVCAGLSVSLTAGGATTYTWSTGSNSSSVVVTPSITSGSFTYNVVGSSSVGCIRTKVDSILVRAIPTLTMTGGNYVCNGNTLNLNVSGASTYSWNTGSTSSSIAVTPSVNTSYSVVGTSTAGCKGTSVNNVTVVSIPTVAITGNTVICFGDSLTLVANGANTYTWSTGSTNSFVVVTPSTATTYSLVGAIGVGCVNSSQTAITVNTLPSLSLTASSKTICLGENTTLTINGANSYTWSTAANSTSISVSPTITSTYSVVGTDANNCSSKDSLTLYVSLCSSISEADWLSKTTRVYPSPNNGVFTIELPETDEFEIVVTNMLGQKMVATKAKSVNTIDLMNFDNGIYFIHVLQNNTIVYRNSIIKE
jgi:hypothetical protein